MCLSLIQHPHSSQGPGTRAFDFNFINVPFLLAFKLEPFLGSHVEIRKCEGH